MSLDQRPLDKVTQEHVPDCRDCRGTVRLPQLYGAIFGQMALLLGIAYFIVTHLQD